MLVGTTLSAVLGFAFVIMVGRILGADGAGVVLQVVGIFTILLSVGTLGLDTATIWLVPRLQQDQPEQVRPVLRALALMGVAWSALLVGLWYALSPVLAHHSVMDAQVLEAFDLAAPFLVTAVMVAVLIAGTRALGTVLPFTLVDRTVVPGVRVLVLATGLLTTSALAVTFAWSFPWAIGMVAAAVTLLYVARRRTRPAPGFFPPRDLVRRILGFAGPRTVSNGLDQVLVWADVILVGALAGTAAAGLYGAAARFVFAGLIVVTALRISVGPRFSLLIASGDRRTLSELYSTTAAWALLLGGPVYITLMVFSPVILGWLGDDFGDARSAMTLLCLGALVLVGAGNVQTLLLMTGRSGVVMVNKSIVVGVNIAANVVLVPRWGIEGAAVAWVGSMLLDTVLAAVQVKRITHVALRGRQAVKVVGALVVCVAVPQLVVAALLGQSHTSLVTGIAVAALFLAGYLMIDRKHLGLGPVRA